MFLQERHFGKFRFRAMTTDEAGKARIGKALDTFQELFNSLDESIGLNKFFEDNKNSVLAKRLDELTKLYSNTDPEFHIKLGSLWMLANDLKAIKSYSDKCFNKFRRDLIRQRKDRTWEGFRFEVRVYATLLKHNCDVLNRERPDLAICYKSNDFFAEVTECKIAHDRTKPFDTTKKILNTISNKNKKPYANSNTILYVNITNVLKCETDKPTDLDKLVDDIKSVHDNKYGAVILYSYSISQDKTRYNQAYKSIISPSASEIVTAFISDIYPKVIDENAKCTVDQLSSEC